MTICKKKERQKLFYKNYYVYCYFKLVKEAEVITECEIKMSLPHTKVNINVNYDL